MDEPVRILVVDDSATIRTALQLILAPTGYAVDFACTGADAIERAALAPPTLVMLDFILPDMRGTEVCRALLADPRSCRLPVVLVSARGAEIRQAYEDVENVVAYLTKPFTPEQVHAVVANILALGERDFGAPTADADAATVTAAVEFVPEPSIPAAATVAPPAADAVPTWAEAEIEADDDDEGEGDAPPPLAARDALDALFETLRAGLEGVHVEESDAPAGGADRSRSTAELAAHLSRQLTETLAHATSGARHTLYSDGSIRSLDDALLDAYRRVCRLVFRAAGDRPAAAPRARVLFVGAADGEAAAAVDQAAAGADWRLFRITTGFCQLPLMARAYGPSHLVVDLGGPTVWTELATLRRMAECRRLQIIGVAAAGAPAADPAQLAAHGIATVLSAGPELAATLGHAIAGESERAVAPPLELEASAA